MAHRTKKSANDVGVDGLRIKNYLGDHIVKFREAQDFETAQEGLPATRLFFEIVKSSSGNLAKGTDVEHTVFVGEAKYKGEYYLKEMRAATAAILGKDPNDTEEDWDNLIESIDGPDNEHAGKPLQLTVYEVTKKNKAGEEKTYRHVRYVAAPKRG